MDIHGHCDVRFEPVRETFERNFREHNEALLRFLADVVLILCAAVRLRPAVPASPASVCAGRLWPP